MSGRADDKAIFSSEEYGSILAHVIEQTDGCKVH